MSHYVYALGVFLDLGDEFADLLIHDLETVHFKIAVSKEETIIEHAFIVHNSV